MSAFRFALSALLSLQSFNVAADGCTERPTMPLLDAHQAALVVRLSQSREAQDLLAAALLHSSLKPAYRCEAGQLQWLPDSDQPERRGLLEAALRAGWEYPELLLIGLSAPTPDWAASAALQAQVRERLLAVEPGNLVHWELAFVAARVHGASEAELADLVAQAASASSTVDTGYAAVMRLIDRSAGVLPASKEVLAALERDWLQSLPPQQVSPTLRHARSETVLTHIGVPDRIERPQPRQLKQSSFRQLLALPIQFALPLQHPISRHCIEQAKAGPMSPPLLEDCRKIAQLMLDRADTVAGAMFGATTLARLARNEEDYQAALQARLQLDWLNSGRHLPNRGACAALDLLDEPCTPEERVYETLAEMDGSLPLLEPGMTEMQMLRERAQASGQPLPPPAWLETQREVRASWGR